MSTYVDWYLRHRRDIQPSSPSSPKVPLKGWRDLPPFDRGPLDYAYQVNRGVIWRLGPNDLVVDVDLYKPGGRESLQKLEQKFGHPLFQIAPTVHTPRGGRHYYFRVPHGCLLRVKHAEYPAVDFKRFGGFVVAAGSPHPEVEGVYAIDYSSPWDSPAPMIPDWLVSKLWYETVSANGLTSPQWSGDQLRVVLANLYPTQYRDHAEWYPLLCACHFATEGSPEGLEVFVEWSCSDPLYGDAEHSISTRWGSLSTTSKPTMITHRTLRNEVKRALGYLPSEVRLLFDADDMAAVESAVCTAGTSALCTPPPSHVQPLPAAPAPAPDKPLSQRDYIIAATAAAGNLDSMSGSEEVIRAVELGANLDSLQRAKIVRVVAKNTGVPLPDVRKMMSMASSRLFAAQRDLGRRARKEFERAQQMAGGEADVDMAVPADVGAHLAEMALQQHFKDGDHLVHTNGQFWEYIGTHWLAVSREYVMSKVLRSANKLRNSMGAAAQISLTALVDQGVKLVTGIVAEKGRDFFVVDPTRSVLNCKNHEIWINKDGTFDVRDHSPSSRLQSVVNVTFDPRAGCPNWSRSIVGMFEPLSEPIQVAGHLMEMIGYSLQTYKNHAAWVLLHGTGRNGKSTILDVISALAGKAAISTSLSAIGDDTHLFATVEGKLFVIDDDWKKRAVLPDDVLKKLSENKEIQINPKNVNAYSAYNTATAWIASNSWPKTTDMSTGMRRRVYAFELKRDFGREGVEDVDLKRKIIDNELSGVLNLSLVGLQRLRQRKRLQRPGDCEASRYKWAMHTNQLSQFLASRIERTDTGEEISTKDVFALYRVWCESEGIRLSYSKSGLVAEMKNSGYRTTHLDKTEYFLGVKVR